MYSKLRYVLVFVLIKVFCQAHAQQSETTDPAQTKTEAYLQNIQQTGGELQEKVFTKIDSLTGKSSTILQTTTDSLNNLSEAIEAKVQSRIDSLQQLSIRLADRPKLKA